MPGGEVRIQAEIHRSGNWITLPITVGGVADLLMVLDTGSPVSVVSPLVEEDLLRKQLIRRANVGRSYVLASLTSQEQTLPEVEVRVLPRLARLGVDGLLGLDFLRLFQRVCFEVDTLRLILEDP